MTQKTLRILPAISWILAIATGIASWASGIYTDALLITGCSWLERHAVLIYLSGALLLVVTVNFLLRMPFLGREIALRRSLTLGALLVFPWSIGLLISGPNSLGAVNRGQQKRTMADIREFAIALEGYKQVHGSYPVTSDPDELRSLLGDQIPLPPCDGWGNPWVVHVSRSGYTLVSFGKCGKPDLASLAQYQPGVTSTYQSDIVFSNGEFVRMPEGTQTK